MAPPPFGFQESLMSYMNGINQEANEKMRMEAAIEAQRQAEKVQAAKAQEQRQELRAEQELAGVADGVEWIKFEEGFNKEFASILHIFGPESELLDAGPDDKYAKSGKDVHVTQLMQLFSVQQRNQLADYFETHQIPERLFNGSDQGHLNAQQRILLSSHILVNGTYNPGDFDQRVHAKNCGHWVQTVQHYAGVTANFGANSDSINGNFDIFGNVVAGGSYKKPQGKGEERNHLDQQPDHEDLNSGYIDPGDAHYASVERYIVAMEKYEEEKAAYEAEQAKNPKKAKKGKDKNAPKEPTSPWRSTQLPIEQFDMVKPGDWLYIYNANGSGNHSVIFSRWASDFTELDPNKKDDPMSSSIDDPANKLAMEEDGYSEEEAATEEPGYSEAVKNPHKVKYRRAITFDQGTPTAGGQAHGVNLGNQYYKKGDFRVSPITLVSKVSPEARPAHVLDELFPKAANEEAVELANANYIAKIKEKHQITEEQLMQWMREDNAKRIKDLGNRLSPDQVKMLTKGNETTDLETLIRITSRLRQWAVNAAILAANEEKLYTKKNAEYAEMKDEFEALKLTVDAKAQPYIDEIAKLEKDLKEAEKALKEEGLKKSTIERRTKNRDKLKTKLQRKREKLAKVYKPYYSMYRNLPFGQVALGSKEGENKSSQDARANGKLENLMTFEEIEARLAEESKQVKAE